MRLLIFFLCVSSQLLAESVPDYTVSYVTDRKAAPSIARIKITYEFDHDYEPNGEIRFSINDHAESFRMDSTNTFLTITTPQKAVFRFYSIGFREIETDSIEIKSGKITIISLHFQHITEPRPVKKPVIYLYPESDLEVSINLKTQGELAFSYPDYSKGWKGISHPDGSVTINRKSYPYLFWEAEQRFDRFDFEMGGFLVRRDSVISSLERYLTELGFNEREQTDFITFWGPQLAQHEQVCMQFILQDACNQFATLKIDPQPAHLNRVYLVWSPINVSKPLILKQQVLKTMNRSGFDVLEWGGIEVTEVVY